jgi:hypothetical protein
MTMAAGAGRDAPVEVRRLGDQRARSDIDRDAEFAAFMAAAPLIGRPRGCCDDEHPADELTQQALVGLPCLAEGPRADPLAYARRTLANLRIETWRRRRREVSLCRHFCRRP